jgi:hypothetical protein
MSDVFTKQRPMIDWDEFERRLHRPCSTDQMDHDPLAELLRIIGGNDESHEAHFEPKNPLSAKARPDAGEPGELTLPEAQVPLVCGDFASIEAGLLGTKQPEAASLPEAEPSTIEDRRSNARAPLISGDFASIEAGLLGTKQPEAASLPEAEPSTIEDRRSNARAPLISDLAAIEARLLEAAREQAAATANMSNALSSMDIESQRFLPQDNQPASRHAGVADGQDRSRRPRYGMVAIVIVAMAGIAVSFGLKSRLSGPPEIASFKGESETAKQQTEATSSADVPVLDAAILGKPEPPPTALDNDTKQAVDLPQVEKKALPALSRTQIDNRPPAASSASAQTPAEPPSMATPIESAPAQAPAQPLSMAAPIESAPAQTPAEPPSMAAPIESEKMRSDLVRPDGTLPSNATSPGANINEAPLPAPQSPAVAKPPKAKAVGRVAKPRKPAAARDSGRHGSPRQIANKAKELPLSPSNAEPAPMADPTAVTPTVHPSPATDGVFGFVQSAVNMLTSAPAKLLELGRNVTGARP